MAKAGIVVVSNTLTNHALTIMRDKRTKMREFREGAIYLSRILAYEVGKTFEASSKTIETPLGRFEGQRLVSRASIVPVHRAGGIMTQPFIDMLPTADQVLDVGVYRDELDGCRPKEYLNKIPARISGRRVYVVVDPMLATAGSAIHTISLLNKAGAQSVVYAGIVSAPEGVKALLQAHPNTKVFTVSVDECLNASNYIVKGLGDFGDRMNGTRVYVRRVKRLDGMAA